MDFNMKIGIGTDTIANQIPDERDAIRKYAELGFEALDYSGYRHAYPDSIYLKEDWRDYAHSLRKAADESGICFSQVHAPMCGPYEIDNDNYKMEITRRCFELCEILGAPYLVVHPACFLDNLYGQNLEHTFEYNLKFYRSLIPFAEKHNVVIGLENMFAVDPHKEKLTLCKTFFSTMEDIIAFMDAIGTDRFGVCLDTGHYHITCGQPAEAVRKLGSRLKLLHVHDNRGWEDDHMAPFFGHVDWADFMAALKEVGYTGAFSSEATSMGEQVPASCAILGAQLTLNIHKALLEKYW